MNSQKTPKLQLSLQNPPKLIAFDFETGLVSGSASTEFYRDDFRALSCAFSWEESGSIKNECLFGEVDISQALKEVSDLQIPIAVHNFGFEYGVCLGRFPKLVNTLKWTYDTMRLVQQGDNGQDLEGEKSEYIEKSDSNSPGLGLEASASRWLPSHYHNHKQPFYEVLRGQFGVAKGSEGGNLHLLPLDQLKAYNTLDSDITLLLCQTLLSFLSSIRFNHLLDHSLYTGVSKIVTEGKMKGVKVNRTKAESNIELITKELKTINEDFYSKFQTPIQEIEQENRQAIISSRKTEKGRKAAEIRLEKHPDLYKFNTGSRLHKKKLFMDKLGFVPTIFTLKGRPSFSKSFLHQWGEGGLMLAKLGTLSISKNQLINLLEKSAHDGRWHIDLMVAGTSTGRLKGRDE